MSKKQKKTKQDIVDTGDGLKRPAVAKKIQAESTGMVEKKTTPAKSVQSATLLQRLKHHWLLITVIIFALATTGLGGAVMVQSFEPTTNETAPMTINTVTAVVEETTEPVVWPRQIDGLIVATADANTVPACVMIENAAFDGVRPQAGLSAASVIYEVIVEGGITRLMAVYAGEHAGTVGPVRSARDTYLEFASELNCAYVHAGGSFSAMQALQNFALRDLDGLREGKWFWRDSHKYSPHNLFTSTDKLYEAITSGHSWMDVEYDPWQFADSVKTSGTEPATEVNIAFGGAYNVTYIYNTQEKYYERWNGNVEHTDANTGKILTTRNIIIQKVPPGVFIEGKGRINFSVTGEGEVYIFREGKLTLGTWKKTSRLARTQFYDDTGKKISLVRGNIWVEIVPETYSFDWKS